MNQKFLLMSFVFVLSLTLMNCKAKSVEKINDTTSLQELVADSSTLLLDVRTVKEFEEGHIEGSVNIPLDKLESSLDSLKERKQIVVFCRSGNRSGKAILILEKYGIKAIDGGGIEKVKNLRKK